MQYREIELTQDKWAVIDALDYCLVAPSKWFAHKSGRGLSWYALSHRPSLPPLLMHRLISCPPDHLEVDHVNGDGLFNSRSNLRWATHQQNTINWDQPQGEHGSGYRGVTPSLDKWQTRIQVNGERLYIGTYDTKEEAARAYDEVAQQYHGRFARLNFPLDKLP